MVLFWYYFIVPPNSTKRVPKPPRKTRFFTEVLALLWYYFKVLFSHHCAPCAHCGYALFSWQLIGAKLASNSCRRLPLSLSYPVVVAALPLLLSPSLLSTPPPLSPRYPVNVAAWPSSHRVSLAIVLAAVVAASLPLLTLLLTPRWPPPWPLLLFLLPPLLPHCPCSSHPQRPDTPLLPREESMPQLFFRSPPVAIVPYREVLRSVTKAFWRCYFGSRLTIVP